MIITDDLTQIKQTKRVFMAGNENVLFISIDDATQIDIPAKVTFQVLRGLLSYTQKYYRRHDKKKSDSK